MPLRLDVKRRLLARSDRVKSVDLHPTETWTVVALFNGNVHIWNYETQQLVKSIEVCEVPVRTVRFVARKSWVVTGSDDMYLRAFNYNTLERVAQVEAHGDYMRSIAVHPTLPYVLTAADDMIIKLWDWDHKWVVKQQFLGHTNYVMHIVFNPKDHNTFATASRDYTIKVWQLGSSQANFTLEGHQDDVNCVNYYHGADKPYLISASDDGQARIWDYQNKTCVAKLTGHTQNVTSACFHPELPIILTGSEDGTVRVWHANTHRLETTLNYGLERAWCMATKKGSNTVAIGYDEGGVLIKMGREEPAVSMDSSGKIVWARHSEMQQANLKTLTDDAADVSDGERLPLTVKDMGACEIYPQAVAHNPNGRFVVACGDGEFIIYTAMALRNKAYGSALEFVWAADSNTYATRENRSTVKIFKNFKEVRTLQPDFNVEGIFGSCMLGVRSTSSLCFFEWESLRLVQRIEIAAKSVFWNDAAQLVAIVSNDSFFVLKYNAAVVARAYESGSSSDELVSDDGVEGAFDVIGEVQESVRTALWVGDCLVYTTANNRLNYYVGGEIVTIAHLDRPLYLLGYMPRHSRLYACDKDHSVVSYQLLLAVLEYQTAVMRRDFETADKVLHSIPKEQRTRVALFLEKQGFKSQALAVSQDADHRFDLALNLGDLPTAKSLAAESDSDEKWRLLGQAATARSELLLAGECLARSHDHAGTLLLASCAASAPLMARLAEDATRSGQNNVGFTANFLLGNVDECVEILLKTERLPEAAFFARTYCPSRVSRVVALWKERVAKQSEKMADALADPTRYENLFPGLSDAFKAEKYLRHLSRQHIPAAAYVSVPANAQRDVLAEIAEAHASGATLGFLRDDAAEKEGGALDESCPPHMLSPGSPAPAPLDDDVSGVAHANRSIGVMGGEAGGRAPSPDIAHVSREQPDVVAPSVAAAATPDVASHAPVDADDLDWDDDDDDFANADDIDLDDLNLDDDDD